MASRLTPNQQTCVRFAVLLPKGGIAETGYFDLLNRHHRVRTLRWSQSAALPGFDSYPLLPYGGIAVDGYIGSEEKVFFVVRIHNPGNGKHSVGDSHPP